MRASYVYLEGNTQKKKGERMKTKKGNKQYERIYMHHIAHLALCKNRDKTFLTVKLLNSSLKIYKTEISLIIYNF